MTIQVEINGVLRNVTTHQLFALAKRGTICPETRLYVNGTERSAIEYEGIKFEEKQVNSESNISMTMDWYYCDKSGQEIGVKMKALKELTLQGLITRDYVLKDHTGRAMLAGEVDGLEFPPDTKPPLPTTPPDPDNVYDAAPPEPRTIRSAPQPPPPPIDEMTVAPTRKENTIVDKGPADPAMFHRQQVTTMPEYFCTDTNAQQHGPIDEQTLRVLVVQKKIIPTTSLVTKGGHRGQAGQISGLFDPRCTNCGKPTPMQARACKACGVKPTGHKKFCRQCGVALNPGQVVCIKCEAAITGKSILTLVSEKVKNIPQAAIIAGIAIVAGCLLLLFVSGTVIRAMNNASPKLTAAELAETNDFITKHGRDAILRYLMESGQNFKNTDSPLILKYIEYFVSQGANVDAKDIKTGLTPLHMVVMFKDGKVAKFLVSKGADVNAKDKLRMTPLHSASMVRHLETVKLLVSKGADVNTKALNDYTPLHMALAGSLMTAQMQQVMVGTGVTPSEKEFESERFTTLFHSASEKEGNEVAKLLVSQGADVNAKAEDGSTPLHLVSWFRHLEIARLLVSKRADVNAKTKDGDTPLHGILAGKNTLEESVRKDRQTPTTGREASILMLTQERVKEILEKDGSEFVKFLVSKGADVNVKNNDGDTPLHLAVKENNAEAIKFLLSQKADGNVKNNDGDIPLHLAMKESNIEVVKILVSNGANVNTWDKNGMSPLHVASRGGNIEVVKILVSNGANVNVNVKDKNGRTPLHWAAGWADVEVVNFLLSHGADVNANDPQEMAFRGGSRVTRNRGFGLTPRDVAENRKRFAESREPITISRMLTEEETVEARTAAEILAILSSNNRVEQVREAPSGRSRPSRQAQ